MNPLSLTYHDVNDAYTELHTLKWQFGQWEDTRNGRAWVFQAPVLVNHTSPYRRVLFDRVRDANPFFHYLEAIWMLAGSEGVKFPSHFAKNIANYSDDGITLNGAYGFRWRYHFELDQIQSVIHMLKKDRYTRRAILAMWDPDMDLERDGKDLPCNTHVYFRYTNNKLDMTVCNRSNDLVWGMLGANMVHMAVLHEYISFSAGWIPGNYYQFTNNLHIYEDWMEKFSGEADRWYFENPTFRRWPFTPDNFNYLEAQEFVEEMGEGNWTCRVLRDNAAPMVQAWNAHKSGDTELGIHWASGIRDEDWKEACLRWLTRRLEGKNETQEG